MKEIYIFLISVLFSIGSRAQASSGAATTTSNSTTTAVRVDDCEVHITDMAGNILLMQQNRNPETTTRNYIDIINQEQSGIYTVQVMHNDEIMNTKI